MSTEELLQKIKDLEQKNKELENKIKILKHNSNLIIDSTTDLVITTDLNGIITYINKAVTALYQYGEDELIGKPVSILWKKGQSDVLKNIIDDLLAGKAITDMETYCLDKKGNEVPVLMTLTGVKDGSEKVVEILGVCKEINSLKLTQKAHKEIENILQKAEDISNQGSWRWDIINDKWYFSDNWLRIHGFKRSGISKKELLRIAHPDDKVKIDHAFEEALHKKKQYDLVHRIIRQDNEELRFIKAMGEVYFLANGEPEFMIGVAQDITEQKKAEQDLQEREENFRYIMKHNPNAIAVYDNALNYMMVSDRYIKDYNVKDKNIIGKHHYEVFPEIPEKWRKIHQKALKGEVLRNDDDFFIRQDGSITYNRWECRPWYKADGSIGGIITYSEVTTESKMALQALADSERRLSLATKSAGVGIWDWDLLSNEMIWDERIFQMYGIDDIPEHYGLEFWQTCLHPDDREFAAEACLAAVRGEKDYNVEFRVQWPDGTVRWIKGDGLVIRDNASKPIRMLGTNYDITERKRAEEELRESEKRFATAFKHSPAPLVLSEINTGLFFDVNDRWVEMLEFSREEQLGKTSKEVGIWDDPKERDRIVGIIRSNGSFREEFIKFKTKSGNTILALWSAETITLSGKQVMLSMITDITERKRAEEELLTAKEKAEEANKLKTKFLHNMSHEVRTPMNGIIGFSEMLDKPDLSEEKRKYYSRIVQNSSHQLLKIIDDILEISTLETKQGKLHETEFCLNDLLMELFSVFSLNSKERNIPLYLKKALHDDQSYIKTDRTKLNKILSNLLENALKFTNEGYIEFGYTIEKSNLILYVKDTGIGISSQNHQIIFERFSQEEKELSSKHGGLGLGLSICKENALLLGGDITIESEKGKGSTFYVAIPYKPVLKESNGLSVNNLSHIKRENEYTILVTEDEEINYLFIEALFENEFGGNYNLIHAKNGQEAVEICQKDQKIDLVLMDIKMPIMNGHEATENIKRKFPNLPIVAQTAYSTESDKQLALKHGCDDFISKPIDKDKLFEIINTLLNIK